MYSSCTSVLPALCAEEWEKVRIDFFEKPVAIAWQGISTSRQSMVLAVDSMQSGPRESAK